MLETATPAGVPLRPRHARGAGALPSGPTGLRRLSVLIPALTGLLAVSVVLGVALGSTPLPVGDVAHLLWSALTGGTIRADQAGDYQIIWEIRLPRTLLAAVVGAGLSVVGVAVQSLVRNALADPFVLGISSGAGVGANAVLLFGAAASLGVWALSASAFAGALLAMVLVYAAARTPTGITPLRLVLTGTVLAYGFSAITTVMIFNANKGEAARSAVLWLLGSLGGATWSALPIAASVVALSLLWLLSQARPLNALAMGDESAVALGVDVTWLRRRLFVVSAAATAVVVAVSGAVGFVGLVVPHIVRMIVGSDHRRVLSVAPLVGACLLVWVDIASRVVVAPRELPLGAITAIVGVPTFVWLIRRRSYVFGGR